MFQESGSEEDYAKFSQALHEVSTFYQVMLVEIELPAPFGQPTCTALEALTLQTMKASLCGSNFKFIGTQRGIQVHTENGHVFRLDVSECKSERLNELISLLPIFSKLQVLNCKHTSLSEFSSLPKTLQELDCSGEVGTKRKSLKELPSLPNSLRWLNISHTQIENLPEIPCDLKNLSIMDTPAAENTELTNKLMSKGFVRATIGVWMRT